MTVNVDAEIGVGCPHLGEVETAYIVHGGIYLERLSQVDADEQPGIEETEALAVVG